MTEQVNDGLIAIYGDAAHAELDFDSLVAWDATDAFDAAVAVKAPSGDIEVRRYHQSNTQTTVAHGLGVGLATGLLVALLPGVGVVAAAGGGAAIGAAVGAHKNMTLEKEEHERLTELAAEALDEGEALLVAICPPSLTERFDRMLTSARRVVQVNVEDFAS